MGGSFVLSHEEVGVNDATFALHKNTLDSGSVAMTILLSAEE